MIFNLNFQEWLRRRRAASLGLRVRRDRRLDFIGGASYQASEVPIALHTSVYQRNVTSTSGRFGRGRVSTVR